IKLLAVAIETEDGIEQRVHPTLVPAGSPIAEVEGVFNAVGLTGDFVDDLMMQGRGAGAHPTASSVISDIADIARGIKVPVFATPADSLKPYRRARMRAHEGGYYVAMTLYDRPGSVACVANAFSDHGISIESIEQRAPAGGTRTVINGDPVAPFILITHDTLESAMRAVIEQISQTGFCADRPRMIRIERY
ncbi:MAG TPA: ACT domain-containing protein, partial [Rhizobiales bacterium]|nr:ACT domain-containing protein [Hyphomicrobiales bacterium]